jgi:hypothetical protein
MERFKRKLRSAAGGRGFDVGRRDYDRFGELGETPPVKGTGSRPGAVRQNG